MGWDGKDSVRYLFYLRYGKHRGGGPCSWCLAAPATELLVVVSEWNVSGIVSGKKRWDGAGPARPALGITGWKSLLVQPPSAQQVFQVQFFV